MKMIPFIAYKNSGVTFKSMIVPNSHSGTIYVIQIGTKIDDFVMIDINQIGYIEKNRIGWILDSPPSSLVVLNNCHLQHIHGNYLKLHYSIHIYLLGCGKQKPTTYDLDFFR